MKKKLLMICIAVFFIAMLPEPILANNAIPSEGVYTEEQDEMVNEYVEEDASMVEKFLATQMQNLMSIGPVASISTLIFGNPYVIWNDGDTSTMAEDGVFTESERENIVNPVLTVFSTLFSILLVISVLISALKLGASALKPSLRNEFWNDALMWVATALLIAMYVPFTNAFFALNMMFVDVFRDLLLNSGINLSAVSVMASDISILNFFSFLIALLAEWILSLGLNFIYLARKFTILILLVIGPIAIFSLLFPRTKQFFGNFLREFIGAVFLQSIHSILWYSMVLMAGGASIIVKLCLMAMFIPISSMISRMLQIGDTSSNVGKALTAVGVGGLVSSVALGNRMLSTARNGGFSASNNGALANSVDEKGGGNDLAKTTIANRGVGGKGFQMAKKVASVAGMGVAATAATVTLNPMAIAAAGAIGYKAGGGVVQAGRNVATGGYSTAQTFLQRRQELNPARPPGMSDVDYQRYKNDRQNDLSARREFGANLGESLGLALGGQFGASAGRTAGATMTGVSTQRIAQTSVLNGGRAMVDEKGNAQAFNFSAYAKQNPNAEMRFAQTNSGSGVFVRADNKDSWMQVGTNGQADATLKNGTTRVIDYKAGDMNTLQKQPNGTYSMPTNNGNGPTVGLAGSVNGAMRTGDAYLVHSSATAGSFNAHTVSQALNSDTTARVNDDNFKASSVNLNSYVAHTGSNPSPVSTSDKTANVLNRDKDWLNNSHVFRTSGSSSPTTNQNQPYTGRMEQLQRRKNQSVL